MKLIKHLNGKTVIAPENVQISAAISTIISDRKITQISDI
jgi:hypothetical protein